MLKVEVRVYDDVKKVTRDQYGKSVESSEREKVVDMAKMIDPGFRAGVV